MTSIQRERILRRMILTGPLLKKCRMANLTFEDLKQRKSQIIKDKELQSRLAYLTNSDKEVWGNCTEDLIIESCAIKDSDDTKLLARIRKCANQEELNKQFYINTSENYYYDKYFIDCEQSTDDLNFFIDVEKDQHEFFDGYLTLEQYACNHAFKYFILYNIEDDVLGGVCQVSIMDNMIVIHFLTSRTAKSSSGLNKGIGSTLINMVKETFANMGFFGIYLYSDPTAIEFYKKVGFKNIDEFISSSSNKENYIYPFMTLDQMISIDPQNLTKWAIKWKSSTLISILLSNGIELTLEQRFKILTNEELISTFWSIINPTPNDLQEIINSDSYATIHLFLRHDFIISHNEMQTIMLNTKAKDEDIYKILNFYFQNDLEIDNHWFIISVIHRQSVMLTTLFMQNGYKLNNVQKLIARKKVYNTKLRSILGLNNTIQN